jgi:hypothetical protein
MTSPNGIDWTSQVSASTAEWYAVAFGNGVFVAVGDGTQAMRSIDNGITWTLGESYDKMESRDITFANGLFVAVGYAPRVLTSPDGITWTSRPCPAGSWQGVSYGENTFVAVSSSRDANCVMTSTDGITWSSKTSIEGYDWNSITFGGNTFAAVSISGNVMTSSATV